MTATRNELEDLLQRFADGALAAEEFARRLLAMQVFLPVRDERSAIAGFQRSLRAEPLVVEDEEGRRVLILFSAPDRAREFLAAHPGYGGGMLVEFAWLLRRMGAELSIAINPGLQPGFDLDPERVAMLAALLPEQDS